MKYILYQNTSYKKRPLFPIETLNDWEDSSLSESDWLKPILISANKNVLKKVKERLMKEFKK